MIKQALGVPISTMSYWFRERPFKPNKKVLDRIKYGPIKSGAKRHNQKVQNIEKLKEAGAKEIGKLSHRDLWMLGIGLYIGEGSKTIESIRIINSDPAVIVVGIKWLKQICLLSNKNIKIRLHLYPDSNEKEAIKFWRDVTGIPTKNFRKSSIDIRENKKASNGRKLPYGTAHISVVSNGDPSKGVSLFRRINGWIYGAINQV